ncbi:T9SS type A sorting domain-containing protein [Pedobacter sp. B4-66]|uniref:T9SS type A sorting domain-containing protein n=1 Tax=Pedobacter sp. B4-66 TaxID=2817280 RepID=UPI001BD95592|nr:T9SS type A sorting domain-containing protein [Pedobacter sp. B4-66]
MQKTFIARIRNGIAFLVMLSPVLLCAQPITTTTLTGVNNFTTLGGAFIPPGNVVTVAPGAIITFNYGLTIDSNAKLIVNNGATIRMADGKRIILQQFRSSSPVLNNIGGYIELNNSLITSLTSSPTGGLWQGIECKEGNSSLINTAPPVLKINGGTIQYANCAFTSFNPMIIGFVKGRIYAQNATFLNNYRSLNMTGSYYFSMPPPNEDSLVWTPDYIENSTFRLTSDFPYTPPDVVNLRGATIAFRSCTFKAESFIGALTNGDNYNFVNNTTAINGLNTMLCVDQLSGNPNGCSLEGFKNGITINNPPNVRYLNIVGNSHFACVNNISILGGGGPAYILGNEMVGPIPTNNGTPNPAVTFCSVFLRNCREYVIEGNRIGYDIGPVTQDFNFGGIVVMNCGDFNNVVYRNMVNVPLVGVGIESIGTNRNAAGNSGLKILCNTIKSTNYDIAIVKDSVTNPVNGIHYQQYIPGINSGVDTSAANLFLGSNPNNPYRNYLSLNTTSSFVYKYNPAFSSENPVYRNFPAAITTNVTNTCPPRKVRNPQPPFSFSPPDTAHLIVTGEDALFFNMASRPENFESTSALEPVQQWLVQNNYNWAGLPQDQKRLVYETENDPMFEGATARSLLALFEDKKYDPFVIIPKVTANMVKILTDNNDKIYPNPAGDNAWVNWTGADATLMLTNAAGQTVLQQKIKSGITKIDLTQINAGICFAEIRIARKVAYQQKVVIAK